MTKIESTSKSAEINRLKLLKQKYSNSDINFSEFLDEIGETNVASEIFSPPTHFDSLLGLQEFDDKDQHHIYQKFAKNALQTMKDLRLKLLSNIIELGDLKRMKNLIDNLDIDQFSNNEIKDLVKEIDCRLQVELTKNARKKLKEIVNDSTL